MVVQLEYLSRFAVGYVDDGRDWVHAYAVGIFEHSVEVGAPHHVARVQFTVDELFRLRVGKEQIVRIGDGHVTGRDGHGLIAAVHGEHARDEHLRFDALELFL